MRVQRRWAVLFAAVAFSQTLNAQNPEIEIGVDGGMNYSLDSELLTLAVPFQRVRAAFPWEHRLAIEPTFSFQRLSAEGESFATLALGVGVLYDLDETRGKSYARPFFGVEFVDASFGDTETIFDVGAGIGTRTPLADRLALRIEASLTGRFGAEGGADAIIGATAGVSFYTR